LPCIFSLFSPRYALFRRCHAASLTLRYAYLASAAAALFAATLFAAFLLRFADTLLLPLLIDVRCSPARPCRRHFDAITPLFADVAAALLPLAICCRALSC